MTFGKHVKKLHDPRVEDEDEDGDGRRLIVVLTYWIQSNSLCGNLKGTDNELVI